MFATCLLSKSADWRFKMHTPTLGSHGEWCKLPSWNTGPDPKKLLWNQSQENATSRINKSISRCKRSLHRVAELLVVSWVVKQHGSNKNRRFFAGIFWALPSQGCGDTGGPRKLSRLSAIDEKISMYSNRSKWSVGNFWYQWSISGERGLALTPCPNQGVGTKAEVKTRLLIHMCSRAISYVSDLLCVLEIHQGQ